MLSKYNGKVYLDEHVQLVNDQLNYLNIDKVFKCKLFALTMVGQPSYSSTLFQTGVLNPG